MRFLMALTTKQTRVLAALIKYPTHKQAAAAAGISERRLREYLQDDEFKQEYRRRLDLILNESMSAAKQALVPAVQTLLEICKDPNRTDTARIAAARAIIDACLRLNDAADVAERLESLERIANEKT